MRLIPNLELNSLVDYVLFGVGLSLGSVLISQPMEQLEDFIANLLKRA